MNQPIDEVEPYRKNVINSPFKFYDLAGFKAIEWFVNASVEDREAFLHAIGGDHVIRRK